VICGIGLSLLALGYAAVLARFTEAHTARIRDGLLRGWRRVPHPWRSLASSVE
jgi:hypothetical protein